MNDIEREEQERKEMMEEVMAQVEAMMGPAVGMLEGLANSDLGARLTKATARLAQKYFLDFNNAGFDREEAFALTKIAMKQTAVTQ